MKKILVSVLVTFSLVLPLASCTGTASAGLIKSAKERIVDPKVSLVDERI